MSATIHRLVPHPNPNESTWVDVWASGLGPRPEDVEDSDICDLYEAQADIVDIRQGT